MNAQYLNSTPSVPVTISPSRRPRKPGNPSGPSFLLEVDQLRDRADVGPVGDPMVLLAFFEYRAGEIVPAELGNERVPNREIAFVQPAAICVARVQNFLVRSAFQNPLRRHAVVNSEKISTGAVRRLRPAKIGLIFLGK